MEHKCLNLNMETSFVFSKYRTNLRVLEFKFINRCNVCDVCSIYHNLFQFEKPASVHKVLKPQ